MESELTLTGDMLLVLALLGLTIFAFASEIVRIDIAAVSIMVLAGLLGLVPGEQLFDGFASNAVIAVIAVMIIGAGLDRTGVMNTVSATIVRYGGKSENRIVIMLASSVGLISAFMQNTGATALFLPVAGRVSSRLDIPLSTLLMPGLLRHRWRYHHDGRLVAADPAQRSDPDVESIAAARRRGDEAVRAFFGQPDWPGVAGCRTALSGDAGQELHSAHARQASGVAGTHQELLRRGLRHHRRHL